MPPTALPCIIPARGGSKGIARKNLAPVGGRPLIVWAIEAALASRSLTAVFVSTEDDEIAAVARSAGADVIARPADLARDDTAAEDVLLHALAQMTGETGDLPDVFVFMQCTSPLTAPEDIDGIVALRAAENADSAVGVTAGNYFLWRRNAAGGAVAVNHDPGHRPMRQARDPEFAETGALYAIRTAAFRQAHSRFCGRVVLFEIPRARAVDIDEADDLNVATALLHARHRPSSKTGA